MTEATLSRLNSLRAEKNQICQRFHLYFHSMWKLNHFPYLVQDFTLAHMTHCSVRHC
jgi:hypothetical protein